MRQYTRRSLHRRRAMAYILAMLLLSMFTVMAVSLASGTSMTVRTSGNYRAVLAAQMSAESGLAFALKKMAAISIEGPTAPDMLALVRDRLAERLNGTGNLANQSVTLAGGTVSVPAIALDSTGTADFAIAVTQLDDTTLRLVVTGRANGFTRKLAVDYAIGQDKSVLKYSVTSRVRAIIAGDSIIEGDVYSSLRDARICNRVIPPFQLAAASTVNGKLMTVLSQSEFENDNLGSYVQGSHQGFGYDEPDVAEYTTADFDTSAHRSEAGNSLNNQPGPDYTSWGRPVYVGRNFTDLNVPTGKNPVFVRCTFNETTFIDVNETNLPDWRVAFSSRYTNSVTFKGCTFNGPVITGVPAKFWPLRNMMNFENDPNTNTPTVFNNDFMPESTILAPNFNVNIGDFYNPFMQSQTTLKGIVVGGIVDVRDYARIEGTILSMATIHNDPFGIKALLYGTNIGSAWGATNIRITPKPENHLPSAIRKKYTLLVAAGSYRELAQ